jgi:hypothetical protein
VIAALVKSASLVTFQQTSAHTLRLADGSVVTSHTVARVPTRVQGVFETMTAYVLS